MHIHTSIVKKEPVTETQKVNKHESKRCGAALLIQNENNIWISSKLRLISNLQVPIDFRIQNSFFSNWGNFQQNRKPDFQSSYTFAYHPNVRLSALYYR